MFTREVELNIIEFILTQDRHWAREARFCKISKRKSQKKKEWNVLLAGVTRKHPLKIYDYYLDNSGWHMRVGVPIKKTKGPVEYASFFMNLMEAEEAGTWFLNDKFTINKGALREARDLAEFLAGHSTEAQFQEELFVKCVSG